jgi:two-component sensor histidine kinase
MQTSWPASRGLLGIAIERQHADADLQKALEHQAMLTREMSHRVKNSLTSVVGLLRLQARSAQSEAVQNALEDAASRITTIAQVHDHLWRSSRIGYVDIADFAGELCAKLQETASGHKLSCSFGHLMISADKAILLGLLINELVTNAAKHAYPGGSGVIRVAGERRGADLHVEVSDQGIGLSKGFRCRPAPGVLGLQGDQEPPRTARRTHDGDLHQAERRHYTTRHPPGLRPRVTR